MHANDTPTRSANPGAIADIHARTEAAGGDEKRWRPSCAAALVPDRHIALGRRTAMRTQVRTQMDGARWPSEVAMLSV